MTLTLEEIIVKGLDEKLRETNYRSKIYGNGLITPPACLTSSQSHSGISTSLLNVATSQSGIFTSPLSVTTSQPSIFSSLQCTITPHPGNVKPNQNVTFSIPESKSDDKNRHKSQDSNSPGDSDYESAQVSDYLSKWRPDLPMKNTTLG